MSLTNGARNVRRGRSAPQIIVLSFVATIAVGTILLTLPVASSNGRSVGLLDAYFTATSATCVTGLVVRGTGQEFSLFGQLVVLGLIQVGGLGLMTMTTFAYLMLHRRITLRGRLLIGEVFGQFNPAGAVRLIRAVAAFTFGSELLGAAILALRFSADMPWGRAAYFGLFHSISAFCNAGFDLFGDSLVRYASDLTVVGVITGLIIIGGVGFLVLKEIYDHRHDRHLSLHARVVLRVTAFLLLSGTALIFLLEQRNPATLGPLTVGGKVLAAWFQSVTPRTAGFNTVNIGMLRGTTQLILIVLMFIGASPAGTGGGIKTTTAWIILNRVATTARGHQEVEAHGRTVPRDVTNRAMAVGSISLALLVAVTGLLLATEGLGLMDVLFETTSAFGTVGLSTGITPALSAIGRIAIPLTMLAGRVGPLTLAVAIASPANANVDLRFPEERLIVG